MHRPLLLFAMLATALAPYVFAQPTAVSPVKTPDTLVDRVGSTGFIEVRAVCGPCQARANPSHRRIRSLSWPSLVRNFSRQRFEQNCAWYHCWRTRPNLPPQNAHRL